MTGKEALLIGRAIKDLSMVEQAIEDGLYMPAVIEDVIELLRQALGWPPGYFDEVIGSLADDPMEEVDRWMISNL